MTHQSPPDHLKERIKQEPAVFLAWALLLPFVGLYACWTMLHTSATFLHISWATTRILAIPLLGLGALAAWPLGRVVLPCYLDNMRQTAVQSPPAAAPFGVLALTGWLYCQPDYTHRFCIAAGVFLIAVLAGFLRSPRQNDATPNDPPVTANPRIALPVFCALTCVALVFTLCAYRSDYDDSVYLQIATQTMLYPERAPLTFDASLGVLYETFRSQIYRFSAYENFSALLSGVTSLHLLNVYYLLLPAVGSVLCMAVAYLLARWFLDGRTALIALAIFLLVLIAWGDNHYSFGNLAFVRLYQGKCWLITLGAPCIVLCGLMLLRHPGWANWLCYAAANIMATGFSANGMVIACGVTLLLTPLAIACGCKRAVGNITLLGAGTVYPVLCGLLLQIKFKHPVLGSLLLEKFRFLIYSH